MKIKDLASLKDKVAITGASGFVGSILHARLPRARALDRSKHRLEDPGTLKSFLKGTQVVFHLAGINAGSGFMPPQEALVLNNVQATVNLIEAIRRYSKEKPLLVLLSSIHVYAQEQKALKEDSKIAPASYYGLTKLMQEILVEQAARQGLLRYCIFRASNVYGQGCRPFYNSAVATFCAKMRRGDVLELFGRGQSQLDLVHVDDVVSVLLNAVQLSRGKDPVYNVSLGKSVTVEQLVKVLSKVSGSVPKLKIVDGAPVTIKVDNSKIRSAMPSFQWTGVTEGIQKTWVNG